MRHRMRTAGWTGGALAALLLIGGATSPAELGAQEPATEAALDSLRAEIARVEEGAEEAEEDALARLREAARAAARAGEEEGAAEAGEQEGEGFVGRQRSLQALNPEISVTGDVFAFYDPDRPDADNFVPRAFELSLQSALDPYSRAKVFIGRHAPGGELVPFVHGEEGHAHEGEGAGAFNLGEGYVEWVNLPGGLGVTLGKFRQRFGTYNRWHAHALPWQSYPLALQTFLGEEGLAQTGVSVHWLAPVEGAGTYEIWLQGTRSDNPFFGDSDEPSLLGHVNAFWDLSPSSYLELGVSGLTGPHVEGETGAERTSSLYQVEAAFNWRPPRRALYRELTLRGALVLSDRELGDPVVGPGAPVPDADAMGAYLHGEFRFGRQWLAGLRYDWVENPAEAGEHTWGLSPTLTWWQSEWVRLRAEYDRLERPGGTFEQLLLQVTFAMGPHKHETY